MMPANQYRVEKTWWGGLRILFRKPIPVTRFALEWAWGNWRRPGKDEFYEVEYLLRNR
jgi:hypothetical protein